MHLVREKRLQEVRETEVSTCEIDKGYQTAR